MTAVEHPQSTPPEPELPAGLAALRDRALAWMDDDPDPAAREELRDLIDSLPAGAAELADRFAGTLAFGTAGLRGPLRAGPNGMNLAVVRRAAAGLARWLAARRAGGPVVIGYDARHGSAGFARETARVVTGAGRRALLLPGPLPTPVLAFAVRRLDAAAGVMVTASHNPPRDNGYKVYLGGRLGGVKGAGAQIVPPVDAEIEESIRGVGRLAEVPLGEPGEVLDDEIVRQYIDTVVAATPGTGNATGAEAGVVAARRALTVAYTPLHGVGARVLAEVLGRAGFAPPRPVPEQVEPDPDFPTVAFPNPEEPGAMDRAIALARDIGADLALANDPDADRCAVAVPDPGSGPGSWRMLRGDEVGTLLADHLMRNGVSGLYATTIVSSSMLRALCAARSQPYDETFTGFKWIVRAGDVGREPLVYGYEEALGYCVAPDVVRDKDGICAALAICDLAAALKAAGRTLTDRLDELAAEFGVYATDQVSIRVDDLATIATLMERVRDRPPKELLGEPVTGFEELRPEADVVILRTASCRLVIRPSGTEPKLKAYLEVVEPVGVPAAMPGSGAAVPGKPVGAAPGAAAPVAAARERAARSLRLLRAETSALLGLG